MHIDHSRRFGLNTLVSLSLHNNCQPRWVYKMRVGGWPTALIASGMLSGTCINFGRISARVRGHFERMGLSLARSFNVLLIAHQQYFFISELRLGMPRVAVMPATLFCLPRIIQPGRGTCIRPCRVAEAICSGLPVDLL